MILETLPGWFWTLLYIVVGFMTFRFVVLNIMKPIMKYRETKYRLSMGAGGTSNPLMAYNSGAEMLENSEKAILMQMDDIRDRLKKRGVDPMHDPAYQELQNQRDGIGKWRQRLNNPVWGMLDQTFFPIVKAWIPDIQKTGKRWMKEL